MGNYLLRLSIIVAVYNVEDYLDKCLSSLLSQDLPSDEYEVVLINDGSTDNSLTIAESIKEKCSNFHIISKENGGLSSVRNCGNEYARGRYIMHVDGDDFVEKKSIKKVLEIAENNNLDLCFYGTRRYPDGKIYSQNEKFKRREIYNGEYLLTHGMNVSSTWCCLYSNDFIKRANIKYYDRIAHQDVEFNLRLYPFAKRVMFIDQLVYNYCVLGESITRTKNIEKLQKNVLDDIIIAHNVIEFAKKELCSKELCNILIKRMNSTILSDLLSFCNRKSLFGYHFAKKYIEVAQKNKVYPIKGTAMNSRMSLLIPLFNIKKMYLLLIRFWNNK